MEKIFKMERTMFQQAIQSDKVDFVKHTYDVYMEELTRHGDALERSVDAGETPSDFEFDEFDATIIIVCELEKHYKALLDENEDYFPKTNLDHVSSRAGLEKDSK